MQLFAVRGALRGSAYGQSARGPREWPTCLKPQGATLGILDLFRKNLSEDDFAALVMQRARHAAQPLSARYDAEAFHINFELADGRMLIMQLGNAFRDTLAVPRTQRHDVIDR